MTEKTNEYCIAKIEKRIIADVNEHLSDANFAKFEKGWRFDITIRDAFPTKYSRMSDIREFDNQVVECIKKTLSDIQKDFHKPINFGWRLMIISNEIDYDSQDEIKIKINVQKLDDPAKKIPPVQTCPIYSDIILNNY